MKKNISINLFGTLYNIDEDAYNLLENYLQSMQRYFGRQEGGAEIADDIEHRVAELLWKKKEAGMTAIDIDVVKGIIDTIGKAEDIASDGNKAESAFANYNKQEGSNRQRSSIKEDFKTSATRQAGSQMMFTTKANSISARIASIVVPTTKCWEAFVQAWLSISIQAVPSFGDSEQLP